MPRVQLGEGPDSMFVDLDTVDDVVKLHQALHPVRTRPQPATALTVRFPGSPARSIFKNGHYSAFEAMYASDRGIGTSLMTELLGVPSPKSVPPIISAWGKRAAKLSLDIKELLEVDRGYEHGKPSTVYRLTPKGREVLRPDTEPARIATSDSGR